MLEGTTSGRDGATGDPSAHSAQQSGVGSDRPIECTIGETWIVFRQAVKLLIEPFAGRASHGHG